MPADDNGYMKPDDFLRFFGITPLRTEKAGNGMPDVPASVLARGVSYIVANCDDDKAHAFLLRDDGSHTDFPLCAMIASAPEIPTEAPRPVGGGRCSPDDPVCADCERHLKDRDAVYCLRRPTH